MADNSSPFDDFEDETYDEPIADTNAHEDDPFGLGDEEEADEIDTEVVEAEAAEAKDDDVFGIEAPAATEDAGNDDPFADQYAGSNPEEGLTLDNVDPNEGAALAQWESERQQVIQKRINDARDAKAKAVTDAKAEIDSFYQARKEQIEKNQAANREEEAETRRDFDSTMEHGTQWEKVGKLANLAPKPNDERKVGRMRKLLIELKNQK